MTDHDKIAECAERLRASGFTDALDAFIEAELAGDTSGLDLICVLRAALEICIARCFMGVENEMDRQELIDALLEDMRCNLLQETDWLDALIAKAEATATRH